MPEPISHQLQSRLRDALSGVSFGDECALLDWLDYPNVGDHMIWMGALQYLTRFRHAKVSYAAGPETFDQRALSELPPGATIVFDGGGNLGDLWPRHQKFRERVIVQNPDRPIVILSQTIHFDDPRNLEFAAGVFNAHPNLTVIGRDQQSYEIAQAHFSKCRVNLAPDMAFELAGQLKFSIPPKIERKNLYHYRADKELAAGGSPEALRLGEFAVKDWAAIRRSWKGIYWQTEGRFRNLRVRASLWRERLSEPAAKFHERKSLEAWEESLDFAGMNGANLHRESWRLVHSGAYQMSRRRLVITNRLHGHILCVLLEIPHIFLQGAYRKNESFYRTWTADVPFCRFITDPDREKVQAACRELGF